MKKGIIAIFTLISMSISAQQNQLDALRDFGEGSEFKAYYAIKKAGDKYTAAALDSKYKLEFINNMHDKLSTFQLVYADDGKVVINSGFGWIFPNHYTKPSLFVADNGTAYLALEGVLYSLKGLKSAEKTDDFTIEKIYISTAKKEAAKKMSMKEKLAALKAGASLPSEISDRDHHAIIKDYLASMLPIQKEATTKFTADEKAEIAAINKSDANHDAEVTKKNAEFWNSEQGQKKLAEMNEAPTILRNDTGSEIWVCIGSASIKMAPGDTEEFAYSVGGTVYLGTAINNSQAKCEMSDVMFKVKDHSGKILNASAVMPK